MRLLAQHSEGFDPGAPWIEGEVSTRQDSRLFTQMVARRTSPHTGREHAFYRLQGPDWVNVIAFTQDLELVVVEQYRHGINEATFEIPGGCCDPGEDPLESAKRELLEESGFSTDAWISLGSCTPNPATQTNRAHTFLALDCKATAELHLDSAEELQVWAFSWKEWEECLRSGKIHHALVLTAFLKLTYWDGWRELRERLGG